MKEQNARPKLTSLSLVVARISIVLCLRAGHQVEQLGGNLTLADLPRILA